VIGGVIERAPLVSRDEEENHLDNDSVVRIWDQDVWWPSLKNHIKKKKERMKKRDTAS
jgi:hypothetical protein